MATGEKIKCVNCGRLLNEGQFYTYKNGTKTEMCKACLTLHIDNFDPSTFTWLLQKMDVPYVPVEWNVLRDKAFEKAGHNLAKMNGMSVFGKYLSKMRLNQFKDKHWSDSQELQKQSEQKEAFQKEQDQAFQEMIQKQYENGEISEAQYRTLTTTEFQKKNGGSSVPPPPQPQPPADPVGEDNAFNEADFVSLDEMPDPAADLTQQDKVYLAVKWGRLYKASQLVALEKDYNKMKESFDIHDADTQNVLKVICKTYLKMNEALDMGDVESYQKLSRVYDAQRKSANFTAAQNKEDKDKVINSASELVEYCEKNGGLIPRYNLDVPLDKVDEVIKDLKLYTKTLINEDPALSREIEDYLKKKQLAEEHQRELRRAKEEGRNYVEVSDEDLIKYKESIKQQQDQDLQNLQQEDDSEESE